MMSNKCVILVLSVTVLVAGVYAGLWKSPEINWQGERNLHRYLQNNPHNSVTVHSMNHTFLIDYIENASADCITPHFPIIRIIAQENHNAWIQIVRTDTKVEKWRKFIDTTADGACFPFYTYDQDFYDNPLWAYTLFRKPLSFWKGHAYAVQVDHENKTVKCLGGIEWGWTLSFYKLRPSCIIPRPLTQNEWNEDWSFFQSMSPNTQSLKTHSL